MNYLTDEKLTILGSAGAIGSNMVQAALTMRLTSNVAMLDPYDPGNEGAAEEIYHCSFPGANVTWTSSAEEALTGASYIISSGGAPRKEGMTREDLLKGNAEIAAQLGKDVKRYCPDAKFLVVIFNPADITGLVALIHSGLDPSRVATLAALDSTRLQTKLSQHFGVPQSEVTGCRTYGGHGEMMAVFASTARVGDRPLSDLIGTDELTLEQWEEIKAHTRQGGKRIIQLRGRSSFQSPAHHSVLMTRSVIDGRRYPWPAGRYIDSEEAGYRQTLMALETTIDQNGVHGSIPEGTEQEMADLRASYEHLTKLRDEVIGMGVIPPLDQWSSVNPNL